jgi:hypothetical protein
MTQQRQVDPALLIVGAFSKHSDALDWACARLQVRFGPIAFVSSPYEFTQTRYYEPTMGSGLRKQFAVFDQLVAPDSLAEIKLFTNELEDAIRLERSHTEPRPLNLDPGILSLGKFMLATTKDQAHRVYLGRGIFAEVTLRFESGEFRPWTWTYADYRQELVLSFMNQAREFYRGKLRR